MVSKIFKQAAEFLNQRKHDRRWMMAFCCMAVLVAFGTVAALRMTGKALTNPDEVLNCPFLSHEHGEDCYDPEGALTCGLADYAVHTHTEDCYDPEGTLVCALPEIEAHEHTEDCYEEREVLICEEEEAEDTEGHTHTEDCYAIEMGVPGCGIEEHAHADECFESVFSCEEEEHTHGDGCYEEEEEGGQALVCDQKEHEHGDGCSEKQQICGMEEHMHGEECRSAENVLICGKEEAEVREGHEHTENCYKTEEILACGKLELHIHGDDCYDEDGERICEILVLEEHVHSTECFGIKEQTEGESDSVYCQKVYEDENVKVTAEYGVSAKIPEEAKLVVRPVTEEEQAMFYMVSEENSEEGLSEDETVVKEGRRLIKIGFYVEEEEILPEDIVTFTIQCLDREGRETGDPILLVYFPHNGPEALIVILPLEEGERFRKECQDGSILVTVEYGISANIPEEAELIVEQITDPEHIAERESELQEELEDEEASIGILMNIGFYLEGEEVEPEDTVKVTLQFLDEEGIVTGEPVSLIHFLDKKNSREILSGSEVDENGATTFEMESFSNIATFSTKATTYNYYVVFNPGNRNGEKDQFEKNKYLSPYGNRGRPSATLTNTKNTIKINLPADGSLGTVFTVNGKTSLTIPDYQNGSYKYKLAGWYNIATKTYYDVSAGETVKATISPNTMNVFYADWVAESYNFKNGEGIATEDTSDFITTKVYDYNELFNVYSTNLTQGNKTSPSTTYEVWKNRVADNQGFQTGTWKNANGGRQLTLTNTSMHTMFFPSRQANVVPGKTGNNDNASTLIRPTYSGTATGYGNSSTELSNTSGLWGITSKSSVLLSYLFPGGNSAGNALGVHYVGEGNYLYKKDADGYYTYNSKENAAVYQQKENRFYIYENTQTINRWDQNNKLLSTPLVMTGQFLPFNRVAAFKEYTPEINYHFGLESQITFYLPDDVTNGAGRNQINSKDMIFEFSGDDDVWVFVDDKLVLDMGGIHGAKNGSINFATGEIKIDDVPATGSSAATKTLNTCKSNLSSMKKGMHTLYFYYMERGAGLSNCKIKFNLSPRYEIVDPEVNVVTAQKVWEEPDMSSADHPPVQVGLYERKAGSTSETLLDTQELNQENGWKYIWGDLTTGSDYEVREIQVPDGYEVSSKKTVEESYTCWTETASLSDQAGEIIILDQSKTYALGSSLEAIDVRGSDGVIYPESVADQIKWAVEKLGSGYALRNVENEKYLSVTDNGLSLSDVPSSFSVSENASVRLCSSGKSVIYSENQFSAGTGTESQCVRIHSLRTIGNSKVTTYIITNRELSDLTVKKIDSLDESKTLTGAEFTLKRSSDGLYYAADGWTNAENRLTVDEKGELTFENLSDGVYILTETKAPENYRKLDTEIIFEIQDWKVVVPADSETVTVDGTDSLRLLIKNELIPGAKIKVIKYSKNSKGEPYPLKDARFKLYKEDLSGTMTINGKKVIVLDEEKVSDQDGLVYLDNDLKQGIYYLTETEAPDGYLTLNGVISIIVTEDREACRTEVKMYDDSGEEISEDCPVRLVLSDTDGSYEVQVFNSYSMVLPESGGIGTDLYRQIGFLLILSTLFLSGGYYVRRRQLERRG